MGPGFSRFHPLAYTGLSLLPLSLLPLSCLSLLPLSLAPLSCLALLPLSGTKFRPITTIRRPFCVILRADSEKHTFIVHFGNRKISRSCPIEIVFNWNRVRSRSCSVEIVFDRNRPNKQSNSNQTYNNTLLLHIRPVLTLRPSPPPPQLVRTD